MGGYVNIQGAEQEIRLGGEGDEGEVNLCNGARWDTYGWGRSGGDIKGMEWVGQGTQHNSGGVGFLLREDLCYHVFKGWREGWLLTEIMVDGKWVTIIVVYLWQRAKKGLNARLESGIMMEEIGVFIESRVSMGRGIVVAGDFNARVGEAVGVIRGRGIGNGRSW